MHIASRDHDTGDMQSSMEYSIFKKVNHFYHLSLYIVFTQPLKNSHNLYRQGFLYWGLEVYLLPC